MKFKSGDKVVCNRYLYLRERENADDGVPAGTVLTVTGFDINDFNPRLCSYYLETSIGELISAPADALDVFNTPVALAQKDSREVVLYNEKEKSLWPVEMIAETEKSYFARNLINECVYKKTDWIILEGGLDILEMINATGSRIWIQDAIALYKAGFRKVEV